jgi:isopentenyldiphosphate isomerase
MEEMLDTFDRNGNFLGVKSRSFCHNGNPGVYHKPVWIWIVNSSGNILVQKRSITKKNNPGKWDMPSAGHVEAGETSLLGCVRETKEELGIDVEEKDFIFLREFIVERGFELAQVYLLKKDLNIDEIKLQVEEVECVKWFTYEEFKKLLYSEEFCAHPNEYKDWICEQLKGYCLK